MPSKRTKSRNYIIKKQPTVTRPGPFKVVAAGRGRWPPLLPVWAPWQSFSDAVCSPGRWPVRVCCLRVLSAWGVCCAWDSAAGDVCGV